MTQERYADGSVTAHSYDDLGNRTRSTITDADGVRTWSYAYDNRNRLSRETKPNGATLEYSYDANGNTLVENDQGTLTEYGYNAQNQLIAHANNGFDRSSFIAMLNDMVGPQVFNGHDRAIRNQVLQGPASW